jgi:hypothetical protein
MLARRVQSGEAHATTPPPANEGKQMGRKLGLALTFGLVLFGATRDATAQEVTPLPERDKTWQTVTGVTLGLGAATQLIMPRLFYSDPEVTVGWKARWHVSVLAPVMTLTVIGALNEFALKDALKGNRPGCDDTNTGQGTCSSFGMLSTHAFGAFASLGHGAGVFFIDTTKYSGGRLNGASLAGNVVVPLALALVTSIGRSAGNWEDAGQIIAGGAAGLGFGFLSGMTYALMQKPECGYSGSMICW